MEISVEAITKLVGSLVIKIHVLEGAVVRLEAELADARAALDEALSVR